MTKDEKNRRVAELLGWTQEWNCCNFICWRSPDGTGEDEIPDYCNDHNAVHDILMNVLTDTQYGEYSERRFTMWMQGEFSKEPSAEQRVDALIAILSQGANQ